MQIGSFTIPPALIGIIILLILFFILAYRRRVKRDGIWELGDQKRTAWTDKGVTGTSFAGHRILRINELGSRREKFGKPAWSWSITTVVIVMVTMFLIAIDVL